MSREEIQNLWDDCRDGAASGEDRKRFDEMMLDDREMAALWGAESRWLSQLSTTPMRAEPIEGPTFTETVVDQWQADYRRRAAMRLRWRAAAFAGGWAAVLLIAASVMWSRRGAPPQQPESRYAQRSAYMPQMPAVFPVTALVQDATEQYQEKPAAVYSAIQRGREAISLDGAMHFLFAPPSRRSFYRRGERDWYGDESYEPPILLRNVEPR